MSRVSDIRQNFEPKPEVPKKKKELPVKFKIEQGKVLSQKVSDIQAKIIDLSADDTAKEIDRVSKLLISGVKEPKKLTDLFIKADVLDKKLKNFTGNSKHSVALKKLEIERILERISESEDPKEIKALKERFDHYLQEYEELFIEGDFDANTINFRRMEGNELKTPQELRYEMMHLAHGTKIPKDLGDTPKILKAQLQEGVDRFIELSNERPQEAQYLLKKMSVIASVVSDETQFMQFRKAAGNLAKKMKDVPETTFQLTSKEGLTVFECTQVFAGLNDKALNDLGADPNTKEFHLTDNLLDLPEIDTRLNLLRRSIITVAGHQVDGALGRVSSYTDEVVEGVRRAAVTNVKAKLIQNSKEEKPKVSKWLHFSAKKASGYFTQIWRADSWGESILRAGSVIVTGGATALIVGAGIGVNFIPIVGPLISPVVVGFAASTPEIYVRLNESVDGIFAPTGNSFESKMKGQMKGVIIDELRDRRVIPSYRGVSKYSLSKEEQKKCDELIDLLKHELDDAYTNSGRMKDVIKAYQRVTQEVVVTTVESDDWIHAAHSEIIADWLYPELESCIDSMGNWEKDSNFKPEAQVRDRFFEKVGLV